MGHARRRQAHGNGRRRWALADSLVALVIESLWVAVATDTAVRIQDVVRAAPDPSLVGVSARWIIRSAWDGASGT